MHCPFLAPSSLFLLIIKTSIIDCEYWDFSSQTSLFKLGNFRSYKMHFRYSEIIDPSTYHAQGLCDGIPLRMHKEPFKETIGAIRAQRDWARLVGPLRLFKGSLGARYSILGVTVPECLPDRMEIVTYANEFAFLYDGNIYRCTLEDWVLTGLVQMLWSSSIWKRYATCFEWT